MAIHNNEPAFDGPLPGAGACGREPRVLDRRFELREVIGTGGMATVYRAWDRAHNRPCAVKVPAEHLARDEEFRQRFRREAEAASALVHPRIVRVYGHGEADSTPYIAMEFLDGGTLRELVSRREQLPEGTAVRIAAEVADALAYAHSRRVVHRDIKPHNILLTADEHVKVADFGIARSLDSTSHTRAGIVPGSTQYISPEQAAGQQAGPASDQYSLGVVLYEMLAGRLPFEEAETPVAMALRHIHEPPYDLHWIRPGLSEATVALVRRLLVKSPEERQVCAAELASNLRRIYARLGRDASKTVPLPIRAGGQPRAAGTERDGAIARDATARLATLGRGRVLSDTARTPILSSRHRRQAIAPQLTIVLVGLVGLWFFAFAAYQGYQSANRRGPAAQTAAAIRAPALVGRTLAAAQDFAASNKIRLAVTGRQNGTVAPDVILAQDPPPGTALAQGAALNLVVSQGSGVVPDVRGVSADAAARKLRAAGLRLGSTSYVHDDHVPSGMVQSQSANPGDHLGANSLINIVVSRGADQPSSPSGTPLGAPAPSPDTTVVPNVTGASLAQAESALRSAGFRTGRISYTYDDRTPAGVVIGQGRAAGAEASPNEAVDLVVSQGPAPPAGPAPQTPPSNQTGPPDQGSPPPVIP